MASGNRDTPTQTPSPSMAKPQQCATCKKPSTEANLLRCSRCQKAYYCSKECQAQDWRMSHKKQCKKPDPTPGTNDLPSGFSPHSTGALLSQLGMEIDLHNLPESQVYGYLINAYRLRVDDDGKFTSTIRQNSLYSDNPQPIRDFRQFLDSAEYRKGLLPSWWSNAKRAECKRLAQRGGWHTLNGAVEKSDIQEHYGDNMIPMELRLIAERVYGKPVTMFRRRTR